MAYKHKIILPRLWNTLPLDLRLSDFIDAFNKRFKTHLFHIAFWLVKIFNTVLISQLFLIAFNLYLNLFNDVKRQEQLVNFALYKYLHHHQSRHIFFPNVI